MSNQLSCRFNQDFDCFAVGLENGFRIYTADPIKLKVSQESLDGGVAIVEMLHRTNYLALVGGGKQPRYPMNKMILYDDAKSKAIVELEFKSPIINVKLRRDRIIVVLLNKVLVYTFSAHPKQLGAFDTLDNPLGVCALSMDKENAVLACPARQPGHVQVIHMNGDAFQSSIVAAHTTTLSCLALSADGTLLATTSEKGTLIRVYDTASGRPLNELRRGMDRAVIYSIAFNHASTQLCVASDKGTIHIFNLQQPQQQTDVEEPRHSLGNRQSSLAFIKDILPKYFSSEWSFAYAKVLAEMKCWCAFGSDRNSLVVVCEDGSWYKFVFDHVKGGECVREAYQRYLKPEDDLAA
jgi:WD40 repeat protein